jgi:cytochrome c oxidase subunit 1
LSNFIHVYISLFSGKITGLQYPETLGQIHFWITFFGVNLTFFSMHCFGLANMPRRIPDYPDAYAGWNAFSSFDLYVFVIRIFCFFVVIFLTLTRGQTHTLRRLRLLSCKVPST